MPGLALSHETPGRCFIAAAQGLILAAGLRRWISLCLTADRPPDVFRRPFGPSRAGPARLKCGRLSGQWAGLLRRPARGEQQGARSSGRGTRFDVAALLSAEPREMIEIVPRRKPGPGRRAVPQGNAKQERGENRSALPPGHRVSGPQPTTDRFSGRPSIRTAGVRIAGVCADPHRTPLLQHPTASGRRQSTGRVCVPAGRCAFETRSDLF